MKDEFLVAVDPKSSTLTEINPNNKPLLELPSGAAKDAGNKTFKSFAWTHPLQALGTFIFLNQTLAFT